MVDNVQYFSDFHCKKMVSRVFNIVNLQSCWGDVIWKTNPKIFLSSNEDTWTDQIRLRSIYQIRLHFMIMRGDVWRFESIPNVKSVMHVLSYPTWLTLSFGGSFVYLVSDLYWSFSFFHIHTRLNASRACYTQCFYLVLLFGYVFVEMLRSVFISFETILRRPVFLFFRQILR